MRIYRLDPKATDFDIKIRMETKICQLRGLARFLSTTGDQQCVHPDAVQNIFDLVGDTLDQILEMHGAVGRDHRHDDERTATKARIKGIGAANG